MVTVSSVRRRRLAELLRWRGLLGQEPRSSRIAGITMLALACIAMVAMQLNYVVVGDAHMMVVLAPVCVCALLYGPLVACVTGGLAGLAELVHASLLPLDYYEMYFKLPFNSVVLVALVGLVMGMLYAWFDRFRGVSGWRRPAGLVVSAVIGSALFTFLFTQSAALINALLDLEMPSDLVRQLTGSHEVFSQFLANLGLMAAVSLVADQLVVLRQARGGEPTIRETFQGWLAVVMTIAYLVCGALAYTGVSVICKGSAEREMAGHLDFLANQLESRDRMVESVARRTSVSDRVLDELHETSIGGVASHFVLGNDGVSLVAEDGTVVSSNVDDYLGMAFEDVVGAGLRFGFDESMYENSRSSEWDMGGGKLGYTRVTEVGYVRVQKVGNYQLMVAMSAADVFQYRTVMMAVLSAVFMAIFGTVYVQASLLLKYVVVRGFDETNEVLGRITEGDLTQVVDVHDSLEFTHLSGGINATVGALKESIAETKARMARELMTAKAIQESALPNTFPPFPQVDKFDIYASMNAAKEVGGDFYDFFLVDDHTLGFLIADVSGKGIPASLFMMAAKTELGNYMASEMDLAQAIQTANYHLCQGNDAGMFVTVWAAKLDWKTGVLTYVNAGHNPPLLRHNGTWSWLRQRGGIFLGTFDAAQYRSETIRLEEGDELLLYTDGVTEAFSVDDEQYGELRLERYLAGHADQHPHALVDGVRADVASWAEGAEQSDDITMLSLEYGLPPEVSGSIVLPAVLESLDAAMDLIHAELARRLCPIAVQNQVDIALEELFVNVCHYAYPDADEPGSVRVDYVYNANPSSITVQLSDQGVPFDPLTLADPTKPTSVQEAKIGGLGIFMAKRSVDDISYLRDGDTNVVVFKKVW